MLPCPRPPDHLNQNHTKVQTRYHSQLSARHFHYETLAYSNLASSYWHKLVIQLILILIRKAIDFVAQTKTPCRFPSTSFYNQQKWAFDFETLFHFFFPTQTKRTSIFLLRFPLSAWSGLVPLQHANNVWDLKLRFCNTIYPIEYSLAHHLTYFTPIKLWVTPLTTHAAQEWQFLSITIKTFAQVFLPEKSISLHSQKRHRLDASCGFYRPDAICQQVVSSSLLILSSLWTSDLL